MRVPARRTLLIAGAGLLLAAIGVWSMWRTLVIPYAERSIERAIGYRTMIGSLYPGLTTWRARDVIVFGAAPFASAPLARIRALDLRLGGPGGFTRPRSVLARGVKLTYLRAGAADNVRGAAGAAPRPRPARGPSAERPSLAVRDASFEAFFRTAGKGTALALTGTASLDVAPDGSVAAEITSAALARPGWGSLRAQQVRLSVAGRRRSFAATGVRLLDQGGKALAEPLTGGGVMDGGRGRLWLQASSASVPGSGRVSGRVAVEIEPGGPAALDVAVALRGLTLAHRRLDRQPWSGLDVGLRARATVWTDGSRFAVDEARLDVLGLPLLVRGFAELRPALRGQWQLETAAPAACAALLAQAPVPVRAALTGLDLDGHLGLRIGLGFDATAWDETELAVDLGPLCEVRHEPAALQALLAGARVPGVAGAVADALPLSASDPGFVALSAMPRALPAAFLTAEDASFYNHPGFDLPNIRRALAHDLEVGDLARGASTITQQLAKNLFLGPERTLARKLEEVVFAWRLHQRLRKERILELYLNVIELGPGIRGVKRAAEVYFGKPVAALGPLEAAHLAALTPNPQGLSRRFRDGRVDESWLRKLYDLLSMMNRSGRLSRADLAAARKSRLVLRRI